MKKGKRLSRAEGLEVLRDAYGLIGDKKEDFICLAIKSAGMDRGIWRDVSAMDMIPELELLMPEGKNQMMRGSLQAGGTRGCAY